MNVSFFLKPSDIYFSLFNYHKSQSACTQLMSLFFNIEEPPIAALKQFMDKCIADNLDHVFTGAQVYRLIHIVFSPEAFQANGRADQVLSRIRSIFPPHLQDAFTIAVQEKILTVKNYIALLESPALNELLKALIDIKHATMELSEQELDIINTHINPRNALLAFVILHQHNIKCNEPYLRVIKRNIYPLEKITQLTNLTNPYNPAEKKDARSHFRR